VVAITDIAGGGSDSICFVVVDETCDQYRHAANNNFITGVGHEHLYYHWRSGRRNFGCGLFWGAWLLTDDSHGVRSHGREVRAEDKSEACATPCHLVGLAATEKGAANDRRWSGEDAANGVRKGRAMNDVVTEAVPRSTTAAGQPDAREPVRWGSAFNTG